MIPIDNALQKLLLFIIFYYSWEKSCLAKKDKEIPSPAVLKNVTDRKHYIWQPYFLAFICGWAFFIIDINKQQLIEKYGLFAMQPITFIVIFITILFGKVGEIRYRYKITKEIRNEKYYILSLQFTLKMVVFLILALLFYVHVLEDTPNLLMCL